MFQSRFRTHDSTETWHDIRAGLQTWTTYMCSIFLQLLKLGRLWIRLLDRSLQTDRQTACSVRFVLIKASLKRKITLTLWGILCCFVAVDTLSPINTQKPTWEPMRRSYTYSLCRSGRSSQTVSGKVEMWLPVMELNSRMKPSFIHGRQFNPELLIFIQPRSLTSLHSDFCSHIICK